MQIPSTQVFTSLITSLIAITLSIGARATAPVCPFATSAACTIQADTIEFVHKPSGVHFMTPCAQEIAHVDGLSEFVRTGKSIRLNTASSTTSGPGIRRYFFYPSVVAGKALPARHFYTNSAVETALLESALKDPAIGCFEAADRGFAQVPLFDSLPDGSTNVASASCAAGTVPVWRLFRPDLPQHRLTDDGSDYLDLLTQSTLWKSEGVKFCSPVNLPFAHFQVGLAGNASFIAPPDPSGNVSLNLVVTNTAPTSSGGGRATLRLQLPAGLAYTQARAPAMACYQFDDGARIECDLPAIQASGQTLAQSGATGLNVLAVNMSFTAGSGFVAANSKLSASVSGLDQFAGRGDPRTCLSTQRPYFGCLVTTIGGPSTPTVSTRTTLSIATTSAALTTGVVGVPYSQAAVTCKNTGAVQTATLLCEATGLPAGMIMTCPPGELNPGSSKVCVIAGTPSAAQTAYFTLRAVAANSDAASSVASITIAPSSSAIAPPLLVIATPVASTPAAGGVGGNSTLTLTVPVTGSGAQVPTYFYAIAVDTSGGARQIVGQTGPITPATGAQNIPIQLSIPPSLNPVVLSVCALTYAAANPLSACSTASAQTGPATAPISLPASTTTSVARLVGCTVAPTSFSLNQGASALMEVGCTQGATPAASVKYQWYRNDLVVAGATRSVFIIPATDTVSVGRTVYRAEISNAAPSSASLSVEVNVRATTPTVAPICSGGLTASPAAIPTGGTTEVTLSMGGCPSGVSYAWSPPSISTSQAQSSLVLKPQLSAVGDSITYVANVCYTAAASLCTPYSAKVTATTLTVIVPPLSGCNVTSSASSVTVGGTATLAVTGCAQSASAGSAPTFQWYLDNVPIVGATQSTYAIPLNATAVPGTYTYKVVVKNSAPSEYQGSWVITVGASRVLPLSGCRISPSAVEVAVGATATLVATCAAGTETSSGVAYQWRRAGVVIPGATLSSYSLSASDTATAGSGLYSASITNSAPSTVSLSVAVTVTSPATPGLTGCVITPDVVTVTVGNTASLTASCAQGLTAATTFQWSRDGISLAGATSPSYVVPTFATTTPGTFSYTVSVANSLSSSAIATSTVKVIPAVARVDALTGCTVAPATQTITTGTATSLSVTCTQGAASGSGVTYAWARNGVSLIGASGASYAVSAAETSTVGVFSYSVSIANAAPSTASASMSLTVTAPAAVTPVCTGAMIASPATVPIGVATVVTFSVGGCANGAQYRWSSPISSFTTPTATDTITLSASRPYAAYTVVVCASAPSSNCTGFSVAVRTAGSTAISGCAVNTDSTVAAVGSSPQLTATCARGTEAGSGVNYQWYRNSTPISGATNSTYVVPASDMIAGVSIAYAFIVSNPNASATAFTVISVSADTRSESCLATPVSVVIKASEPYRKFYTSNYHTTPPGGYFVVAVDVDASDSTVGRYLAEVGFSDFGATRSGRYVTMSKSKCDFTEGAQWISVNVGGVKLAENAGGGTIAMGADTRPASAKLTPGRWYLNFQNPPGACPANVASCDAVISWMN